MAFNPQEIQQGNFDAVIKLCSDQARKFKDNPDKAKKYEEEKKKLQKAKTKLADTIEATKNIKMKSGKTFYEEFVDGKENLVTLFYLSEKRMLELLMSQQLLLVKLISIKLVLMFQKFKQLMIWLIKQRVLETKF